MCCCLKKFAGFLLLLVVLAELALVWWVKEWSPSGLMGWVETRNTDMYYGADAPDPPYKISPEDRQLLIDMVAEAHALSGAMSDFETITALRNWSRNACPEFGTKSPDTNDPSDVLQHFESGGGGACGSIGVVYAAALIAHGYRTRVVQLIRDPNDILFWNSGPYDTHIEIEVYSPDHAKWIVSDPTFNCWFHRPDSDTPLSALELMEIVHNPGLDVSMTGWVSLSDAGIVFAEYDGYDTQPKADAYYIDPVLLFNNVFLLYYDIYSERTGPPIQKYMSLLTARFMGTEKIVRLIPPGDAPTVIVKLNTTANLLPIVGLILLVIMLIPSTPVATIEEEELDEDEEWDEDV